MFKYCKLATVESHNSLSRHNIILINCKIEFTQIYMFLDPSDPSASSHGLDQIQDVIVKGNVRKKQQPNELSLHITTSSNLYKLYKEK